VSTADSATDVSAALATLVAFAHALRAEGVTVSSGQVLAFCRGAALLDLADRSDLYWTGRACLVSRRADGAAYDRVFTRWFGGGHGGLRLVVSGTPPAIPTAAPSREEVRVRAQQSTDRRPAGERASAAEVLRHKRFDQCSPEELAALQALLAQLRLHPPLRRTRRRHAAERGRDVDLRRTLQRALRTQGELLHRAWRAPRTRPRRLVLLLDISGSMAPYARALLQFSHSAASGTGSRTEVFCFGTRLTRITAQLRDRRRVDEALADATAAVLDWEGGTRIGESLATFLRLWGRRGLARGAVVLICSDGLERGDPELLGLQMRRLARLAHRIVWVNPLKADPRYEPLARGMRAALPSVDVFLSGHDLASLEGLAALLPALR
jgi:uncharacterized protein with von Willebrand factor type A (vWA) domain